MYLLYSFLLTIGFIILLPRFAIDAFRSGKYVTGLKQRLGNLPQINSTNNSVIWLHCVSVGEARAAQSLARALLDRFPASRLVVSTTTVTGQQVANEIFAGQAAAVFYFPIDWAWTVRRALRAIQPSVVLIMETERECRKKQIPVALLNGRISNKSFQRYKLIHPFIRRVLDDLTCAMMQSPEDAGRIRELGVKEERVKVSGNLKFDSASATPNAHLTSEFGERFNFSDRQPLIVAASTHAPEEAMIVEAFKQTRTSHPEVRLLIAPRHPERFQEVARLLAASGFTWARRSDPPSGEDANCDVVLLDTVGELGAVYSLAEMVFVGGSIVPHGGHNLLEPAAQGVCTITGPYTHNFAWITKAMLQEEALIQLPETSDFAAELASTMDRLLSDEKLRREIGARARSVCQRNRGATEKTVEMISQLIASPAPAGQSIPFSTLRATAAK
jgi:3-deoxy-D-manno-octulosonic-acid transferase